MHAFPGMRSRQPVTAALLAVAAIGTSFAASAATNKNQRSLPDVDVVKNLTRLHLAAIPGYQPGDIISRSQVESLLKAIHIAGWRVGANHGILKSTLADTEYLVRQLRTPAGVKLTRAVATSPLAYDRLHRMSGTTRGRQLLIAIVKGRGMEPLIHYLTTPEGNQELAKELSSSLPGDTFSQPTGRIYTEAHLVERLEVAHEKDRLTREGASR